MTKAKLTPKQIELLRRLDRSAKGISWALLSGPENANGTRLAHQRLTRWEFNDDNSRRQTYQPEDRTLHITDAGREALKEIRE